MTDGIRVDGTDRREHWERRWAEDDFAPRWRTRLVPPELRRAVAEGWFPAGATALDIGCGEGDIARWLARQGHEVTGIDFAEAAISRAEAAHGGVPGLRFEVVDICERAPDGAPFDVLFDRGCLHAVEAKRRPDYVRNAVAASTPGARFLLLFKVGPATSGDAIVSEIETLVRGAFEVIRHDDCVLSDDSASARDAHRGVALWMVRQ